MCVGSCIGVAQSHDTFYIDSPHIKNYNRVAWIGEKKENASGWIQSLLITNLIQVCANSFTKTFSFIKFLVKVVFPLPFHVCVD
jgi:hypothetical protein